MQVSIPNLGQTKCFGLGLENGSSFLFFLVFWQPDITWLGGITEARRVVALAAAHDILVVPHGSSVYSYHLQYAFTNCPLAEYINLSPKADQIVPYFGTFTRQSEFS